MSGRGAVRDGKVSESAVGRGTADGAEVVVAGRREHVQSGATTARVRTVVDGLHQVFIDAHGYLVGISVVIAEKRRVVADVLPHGLLVAPVCPTGVENLFHRVAMVLEDVLLQRREAVGDGAEAGTLDVGSVVAGSTAVVVATLLDAVVDVEREERSRRIEREHAFDIVVHRKFQVHEVHHLLVPSLIEFLKRLELARVASLEAKALASLGVDAIVQRNLQNLRRVQIARQQIGLLAEGAHLDAARATTLASILERLAVAHEFLDVGVGIEDAGVAVSLANHLDAFDEEVVGGILCYVDGETRLQLVQLLLNLQNHVRQLVGGTASFAVHATYINIREVVVGAALQCRDTHLRRRRLVVELDPQARQQFLCVVARQRALVDALLIEREQMLVDVAGVHGVPAVELGDGAQMHEPVHLNGLPQVAGRMGRHPAADVGNLLQLLPTLGVLFFCSHLLSQLGMALGKENGGVARHGHGFQLLLLVGGLRVVDVVESADAVLDTSLHVEQSLAIHLAVHSRVACGTLLHELGEHAGMVGLLPLLRHVVEDAFALRLALPVRDDLALVGVDVLLRDVVRLQLARVERVQVFHRVARQLRKCRHGLGHRSALANDELVGADVDGLLLANLIEVLRTQHGNRHRAVVLLVELGFDECALDGERCRGVEVLLAQPTNAVVHAAKVFWVFDLEVHALLKMFVFCNLQM